LGVDHIDWVSVEQICQGGGVFTTVVWLEPKRMNLEPARTSKCFHL